MAHPANDHATWRKRDAAVVWHGFTQMDSYLENHPIVVERAEGRELVDVEGNRYLDAISSLWVNTLGHRVPELDAAIKDQLDQVAHSTMLGHGNRVVVELAEALAEVVPVDRPHVLFASDGACAVEQALKIAFQYWVNRGIAGRTTYMTFGGAYHGDTVGALSLGDGGFGSSLFDPLRFPVCRAPGPSEPDWVERSLDLLRRSDDVAAVVIEPLVQAAAGMRLVEADEVAAIARACREADVLFVVDEVATGFGRTGALFATSSCGVAPDILCLGKGITGGYLPMSATVAGERVFDAFRGADFGPRTLYHGHSYGGNALAAAVALRHLRLLRETDVLANVRRRSAQLRELLDRRVAPLAPVAAVRLRGLMGGVELSPGATGPRARAAPQRGEDGRSGRRVCAAAVARGVLLRPLGDVVVLMLPLTVTAAEVERVADVLVDAISEACG